jgi:hypothetical protein
MQARVGDIVWERVEVPIDWTVYRKIAEPDLSEMLTETAEPRTLETEKEVAEWNRQH